MDDARTDRIEREIEGLRSRLENNVFLRSSQFEEFRKGFDKWQESQDRTNSEIKDWQNKMNWSLIGVLITLAGQALFILLTRR